MHEASTIIEVVPGDMSHYVLVQPPLNAEEAQEMIDAQVFKEEQFKQSVGSTDPASVVIIRNRDIDEFKTVKEKTEQVAHKIMEVLSKTRNDINLHPQTECYFLPDYAVFNGSVNGLMF